MKRLSKRMMSAIDRVSILTLSFEACLSVLGFATLYWMLEPYQQGITKGVGLITFGDCLYFSVVTFTSLGYGDILPVGFGKAVACFEVVFGLAFLGIFIAKLSSSKQSYHLAQLYARDAQERLDDYAVVLQGHRQVCNETLELLRRGNDLPVL